MSAPQPKLFPTVAAGYGGNDFARTDRPVDRAGADANATDEGDADCVLTELRARFEQVQRDVALVAERRAAAVAQTVSAGADHMRHEIRKAPGISLAVAATVGVCLAIAVTASRPAEPAWRSSARRYETLMRDDLDALVAGARSVSDDARGRATGIMPGIERLAQTLSQMDVNTTMAPALEKGSALLRTAWQSLMGSR